MLNLFGFNVAALLQMDIHKGDDVFPVTIKPLIFIDLYLFEARGTVE
jgi:hypothetical protein